MNLLCVFTVLLVLGAVHCDFDIGPCNNHALDGQSCSFHFNDREQTCTAGLFYLTYNNCDTKCHLDCDLHPPRHQHCENDAYLDSCDPSLTRRGYCQKDCGISTYVTSYKGCPNFPGWLSCPDYCCCDTCGGGPPGPPGPPESCPYYTRHFPTFGTCENRKGADNDQVCPPVKCRSDMIYLPERCVCVSSVLQPAMNWDDANDYCAATYPGGHLMLMRFQSELDFMMTQYGGEQRIWIGMTRHEADHPVWRYRPDDRPVKDYFWLNGQPNNINPGQECMEVFKSSNTYYWTDLWCNYQQPFICEMEPYV